MVHSDHYTDTLLLRLNPNGTPSFHDYGHNPPAVILDMGCGQGHWILQAATAWKSSQIIGFDLVDVTLPVLERMENVAFVRGNLCVSIPSFFFFSRPSCHSINLPLI